MLSSLSKMNPETVSLELVRQRNWWLQSLLKNAESDLNVWDMEESISLESCLFVTTPQPRSPKGYNSECNEQR